VTARCWLCGSEANRLWKPRSLARPLESKDLQITDARYGLTLSLRRCDACGFIFADDVEVGELVALYECMADAEYEATQNARLLQMRWVLDAARRTCPTAQTWLDIGAGAGLLVREAQRQGMQATGVEPSRSLVEAGRRLHGVELQQGVFPHPALSGRTFDIILLVDVIEHVSNPTELLRACREALSPAGRIVVVTPDVGSRLARVLGHRWSHFRLAHVGYFTRRTLSQCAEAAGLRPLKWERPRWFFEAGYLAVRLGAYLPLGWLNRRASRWPVIGGLYRRVIPVNLHDSWTVYLGRPEAR
jgi:2-polyprenyl-3-methyl-5-hydroxy-6-metoxy-1,4-benzoquinol methylase